MTKKRRGGVHEPLLPAWCPVCDTSAVINGKCANTFCARDFRQPHDFIRESVKKRRPEKRFTDLDGVSSFREVSIHSLLPKEKKHAS